MKHAGTVPAPLWKQAAASLRLGQRLLRFMAYNALPLPDGSLFVTFGKRYGILSGGDFHSIGGIEKPGRALRGACAQGRDGMIYFGEYITGRKRVPISVYACGTGSKCAGTVHKFEVGEVRHVHGIYCDPYTGDLWCLTGDLPEECRIIKTSDYFKSMEIIGSGDETWRAVSVQFRKDAVYYATDAEFGANYIYRIDRKTCRRDMLTRVDGPVYYSRSVGDDLLFCVTAELCPSQKGTEATLWHVDPDDNVNKVYSVGKDLFAYKKFVKFFLPGLLNFPAGPGLDHETYFNAAALRGIDNMTFRIRINCD